MQTILRSVVFIKSVHTLIFLVMCGFMVALLFEVITNQITYLSWLAIAIFCIEGIVLMFNHWRCPLAIYAENVGAIHGLETDIYLPRWVAIRIFPVCSGLFVSALLLLAIRMFG